MPRRSVSGPPAAPDVSVVVIGYNDRANLPQAIRSVLDQTPAQPRGPRRRRLLHRRLGRRRRRDRPRGPAGHRGAAAGEQRRLQPAAQRRHRPGPRAVRDVPRQRRRVRAARLQEPAAQPPSAPAPTSWPGGSSRVNLTRDQRDALGQEAVHRPGRLPRRPGEPDAVLRPAVHQQDLPARVPGPARHPVPGGRALRGLAVLDRGLLPGRDASRSSRTSSTTGGSSRTPRRRRSPSGATSSRTSGTASPCTG